MLSLLYPQKKLILQKINRFFSTNQSGYLCVPTGWGKTFLSKHLILQYIQANQKVLFLVSQNNPLLTQTALHNQQRVFPNSLILSSKHDSLTLKEMRRYLRTSAGCVIFASLQTILSTKNQEIKELLAKKINLLIVDEIHNFIENKGSEFIRSMPPECKIFGMTATPFQGILDNKKYVEDICGDMALIHHEPLIDCIDSGMLSKINYTIINSGQSVVDVFDFSRGLSELVRQELTMDCTTKAKIEAAIKRTKLAKKVFESQSAPMSKTLVFCSPTRNFKEHVITAFHAKLSSLIFNDEPFMPGINFSNRDILGNFKKAAFLSSDMATDEKQEIIENFKNLYKPPYILCTVGMLIEGFNFPDLQNLILLRPTLSMRLFEQQLGRILRKPVHSLKEWGNVYEVADDINFLYRKFKDQIFNPLVAEQLQILQPRIRFELLLFGDRPNCKDTPNVKIAEIRDKDMLHIAIKNSATNQQIEHLKKMLKLLDNITCGSLKQENVVLQKIAARIRMYNLADIYSVVDLTNHLLSMLKSIPANKQLSVNCRTNKAMIVSDLSYLLKVVIASTIERFSIPSNDRVKILFSIGCNGGIQDFKRNCFYLANKLTVEEATKIVNSLEDKIKPSNAKGGVLRLEKQMLIERQYYQNWLQFI